MKVNVNDDTMLIFSANADVDENVNVQCKTRLDIQTFTITDHYLCATQSLRSTALQHTAVRFSASSYCSNNIPFTLLFLYNILFHVLTCI